MPEENRNSLWRESVSVFVDAETLARIDLLVDHGVFSGRDPPAEPPGVELSSPVSD